MDILNLRMWMAFYLICFVAVLWATFLLVQGFMLWVSLTLVTIVIGFNCILLIMEIRTHTRRKKSMEQLSEVHLKDPADPDNRTGGK